METTICDEPNVIPAVVGIEFDADGNPLNLLPVEVWFDELDTKLINHYGEEFRILVNQRRMKEGMKLL